MNTSKQLQIKVLSQEEWKAFRIINFTVGQVSACFIYERHFNSSTQIGNNNNTPYLPLDEIDEFILNWFRLLDDQAKIESHFFTLQHEITDFYKRYSNASTCMITLSALPTCGNRSLQELTQFQGIEWKPVVLEYKIIVYGYPQEECIMIRRNYDIGKTKEFEKYITRIKNEISQPIFS